MLPVGTILSVIAAIWTVYCIRLEARPHDIVSYRNRSVASALIDLIITKPFSIDDNTEASLKLRQLSYWTNGEFNPTYQQDCYNLVRQYPQLDFAFFLGVGQTFPQLAPFFETSQLLTIKKTTEGGNIIEMTQHIPETAKFNAFVAMQLDSENRPSNILFPRHSWFDVIILSVCLLRFIITTIIVPIRSCLLAILPRVNNDMPIEQVITLARDLLHHPIFIVESYVGNFLPYIFYAQISVLIASFTTSYSLHVLYNAIFVNVLISIIGICASQAFFVAPLRELQERTPRAFGNAREATPAQLSSILQIKHSSIMKLCTYWSQLQLIRDQANYLFCQYQLPGLPQHACCDENTSKDCTINSSNRNATVFNIIYRNQAIWRAYQQQLQSPTSSLTNTATTTTSPINHLHTLSSLPLQPNISSFSFSLLSHYAMQVPEIEKHINLYWWFCLPILPTALFPFSVYNAYHCRYICPPIVSSAILNSTAAASSSISSSFQPTRSIYQPTSTNSSSPAPPSHPTTTTTFSPSSKYSSPEFLSNHLPALIQKSLSRHSHRDLQRSAIDSTVIVNANLSTLPSQHYHVLPTPSQHSHAYAMVDIFPLFIIGINAQFNALVHAFQIPTSLTDDIVSSILSSTSSSMSDTSATTTITTTHNNTGDLPVLPTPTTTNLDLNSLSTSQQQHTQQQRSLPQQTTTSTHIPLSSSAQTQPLTLTTQNDSESHLNLQNWLHLLHFHKDQYHATDYLPMCLFPTSQMSSPTPTIPSDDPTNLSDSLLHPSPTPATLSSSGALSNSPSSLSASDSLSPLPSLSLSSASSQISHAYHHSHHTTHHHHGSFLEVDEIRSMSSGTTSAHDDPAIIHEPVLDRPDQISATSSPLLPCIHPALAPFLAPSDSLNGCTEQTPLPPSTTPPTIPSVLPFSAPSIPSFPSSYLSSVQQAASAEMYGVSAFVAAAAAASSASQQQQKHLSQTSHLSSADPTSSNPTASITSSPEFSQIAAFANSADIIAVDAVRATLSSPIDDITGVHRKVPTNNNNNNSFALFQPSSFAFHSVPWLNLPIDYSAYHRFLIRRCASTMTSHHDCSICLMAFGGDDSQSFLPCGHSFHSVCLTPWLQGKNVCPTCSRPLLGQIDADTADRFDFPHAGAFARLFSLLLVHPFSRQHNSFDTRWNSSNTAPNNMTKNNTFLASSSTTPSSWPNFSHQIQTIIQQAQLQQDISMTHFIQVQTQSHSWFSSILAANEESTAQRVLSTSFHSRTDRDIFRACFATLSNILTQKTYITTDALAQKTVTNQPITNQLLQTLLQYDTFAHNNISGYHPFNDDNAESDLVTTPQHSTVVSPDNDNVCSPVQNNDGVSHDDSLSTHSHLSSSSSLSSSSTTTTEPFASKFHRPIDQHTLNSHPLSLFLGDISEMLLPLTSASHDGYLVPFVNDPLHDDPKYSQLCWHMLHQPPEPAPIVSAVGPSPPPDSDIYDTELGFSPHITPWSENSEEDNDDDDDIIDNQHVTVSHRHAPQIAPIDGSTPVAPHRRHHHHRRYHSSLRVDPISHSVFDSSFSDSASSASAPESLLGAPFSFFLLTDEQLGSIGPVGLCGTGLIASPPASPVCSPSNGDLSPQHFPFQLNRGETFGPDTFASQQLLALVRKNHSLHKRPTGRHSSLSRHAPSRHSSATPGIVPAGDSLPSQVDDGTHQVIGESFIDDDFHLNRSQDDLDNDDLVMMDHCDDSTTQRLTNKNASCR